MITSRFPIFLSFAIIGLGISAFLFFSKIPEKKILKVLTYSSFAGVYGPGRDLKEIFKSFCECELQWFLAEDSTALSQRFALIPGIDVVIGWDQITLQSAEKGQWENLDLLKEKFIKEGIHRDFGKESFLQNPYFFPLDWAPIGFIHKDKNRSLESLKSLYKIKGKISLPEPHSSTLGLQFYYWIYEVFEGNAQDLFHFLKTLKNKIYGPVFSWSLAYGFFQKGQTDMGLSYLSSLLYHQKEDKGKPHFFAYFKEGHPCQFEFFSISKKSKNKKLALVFATFLLSKEAQKLIQEKHYMFSVSKEIGTHKLLKQEQVKFISYKRLNDFIHNKEDLLKMWEKTLY